MENLYKQKTRTINAYINLLISKIKTLYAKEIFLVGYNKKWKNGMNMGKENNRRFQEIPFARILKRLRQSLENEGKILIELNEAYTSKCDALALEKIEKHKKYSGKRKDRLFQSKMNGEKHEKKLIHSDINGAINIMRKKYTEMGITGEQIFNPSKHKIKLYRYRFKKKKKEKIPCDPAN